MIMRRAWAASSALCELARPVRMACSIIFRGVRQPIAARNVAEQEMFRFLSARASQ